MAESQDAREAKATAIADKETERVRLLEVRSRISICLHQDWSPRSRDLKVPVAYSVPFLKCKLMHTEGSAGISVDITCNAHVHGNLLQSTAT